MALRYIVRIAADMHSMQDTCSVDIFAKAFLFKDYTQC